MRLQGFVACGGGAAELERSVLTTTGYGFARVTTAGRVVLGRVRCSALGFADDSSTADDIMEPGPGIVRFNMRADELVQRLAKRDLKTAVVTMPNGCLVGVFHARTRMRGALARTERGNAGRAHSPLP